MREKRCLIVLLVEVLRCYRYCDDLNRHYRHSVWCWTSEALPRPPLQLSLRPSQRPSCPRQQELSAPQRDYIGLPLDGLRVGRVRGKYIRGLVLLRTLVPGKGTVMIEVLPIDSC
ncbi:hypothetical protein B0T14DRAFT_513629 [Immersiella caudata]|uniref:Uncharacterized protein n=1 Tax=Immersiella caudata TaxID=314043 RepID=A0AA39X634_9PEZI|nr:hypothetical protein B0T14DRAFT_513629 [Immersiella caudata]